jgi:hypothetical protein
MLMIIWQSKLVNLLKFNTLLHKVRVKNYQVMFGTESFNTYNIQIPDITHVHKCVTDDIHTCSRPNYHSKQMAAWLKIQT